MNVSQRENLGHYSTGVNFGFDLEENEVLVNLVNLGGDTARFKIGGREKECHCGDEKDVKNTKGVLGSLYMEDVGGNFYFEEILSIMRFSNGEPIPEYSFSVTPGHQTVIRVPISNREENTRDLRKEYHDFVDYSDFDLYSCDEVRIKFKFECKSPLPSGFKREYSEVIDVDKLVRESVSDKI